MQKGFFVVFFLVRMNTKKGEHLEDDTTLDLDKLLHSQREE